MWSIKENPSRLTKEGCKKKVHIWEKSQNRYVLSQFRTMLKHCKNFSTSGKTKDGFVIWSRYEDGSANWVESKNDRKDKR